MQCQLQGMQATTHSDDSTEDHRGVVLVACLPACLSTVGSNDQRSNKIDLLTFQERGAARWMLKMTPHQTVERGCQGCLPAHSRCPGCRRLGSSSVLCRAALSRVSSNARVAPTRDVHPLLWSPWYNDDGSIRGAVRKKHGLRSGRSRLTFSVQDVRSKK